jgi:L-cystine uptake protein TcyP (sodium:dicarboxylate symporter family)
MNVAVKWSVILAVLVTALTVVLKLSGLHANPIAGGVAAIGIAIVLNLVVVYMALRQTASESTYGKQVLSGVLIGLIGGALIFLSSWLLLAVVFPDYLEELREGYVAWLESTGMPEGQLQQQIEQMDRATPLRQSVPGFIGTLATSIVAAAIIGIFLRKK